MHFFFSSRRRHTRLQGDWSSDMCSSDLERPVAGRIPGPHHQGAQMRPAWWIVFTRELRDLWVGGKALYLILIYTLLLGVYSYLFASNTELQLLPLKLMVLEIVKASVAVGMFVCLIIGADSFSGERERGTLEALLLTPASRQQIVL